MNITYPTTAEVEAAHSYWRDEMTEDGEALITGYATRAGMGPKRLYRIVGEILFAEQKRLTACNGLSAGIRVFSTERHRQIMVEGYDAKHDAAHGRGELISAALCYASVPLIRLLYNPEATEAQITELMATDWPWEEEWWKPSDDPLVNLAKAGALLAAEYDRRKAEQERATGTAATVSATEPAWYGAEL